MSKATKRKHVTREVLEDYILPEENQQILKILGGRGNNLHEAQTSEGDKFLISMPTRFRKNVWIKRGDFVLVDPIIEGDKVKAEIVAILYPKQIKYIKQEQLWPEGFEVRSDESRLQDQDTNVDVLTNQLNDASIDDRDVQVECKDNSIMNEQVEEEEEYSSEDNDDDLFVNTNRPTVTYYYSDSSEEEEEEEEEEEDNSLKGEIQDCTDDDHSADR